MRNGTDGMKTQQRQNGFSLMEVNMAIFVMAVGILGMVALYPLGLRESTQGQADLKQAMFADYVLKQLVAAASQTNITWTEGTNFPPLTISRKFRTKQSDASQFSFGCARDSWRLERYVCKRTTELLVV
jgi:Tfp pilus assembly protein PilV